jgi:hypothetical protein
VHAGYKPTLERNIGFKLTVLEEQSSSAQIPTNAPVAKVTDLTVGVFALVGVAFVLLRGKKA